jgi:hypothetical protein
MLLRRRSWRSLMRPASWRPEIELRTLRCDTVGVSVAALVLSATLLISYSMSKTLPFAFISGAAGRMTPVLR